MNGTLHLNVLLNVLINNYFGNSRCIFLFDGKNRFEFINNVPIVNVNIEEYLDYSLIFNNFGCQDIFIFNGNSAFIFDEFEYAIFYNITKERYMNRRYVIVTSHDDMNNILKLPRLEFVKDLLIIIPNTIHPSCNAIICKAEEKYMFYTHTFGGKFNDLQFLDAWHSKNQSFMFEANLFPDKTKNVHRRLFRLLSVPYQPNTIVRDGKYEGTELGPMLEFCKKYNYTPKYIFVPENDFGQIYENGSSDGLSKLIVDGEGEVAFGSIGRWVDYYTYSEFAKPMIRSGITCIVPLPGVVRGWKVLVLSFSMEMWITTIITVIICSIVYYFIKIFRIKISRKINFKNISKAQLYATASTEIISMYLLQPVQIPNNNLTRFFLIFILYAVVSISNAYSSGLFSFLTVPRIKKTIDSVQDMADAKLIWAGGTEAWITTIYYYEEPKFRTIIKNFVYNDSNVMRNMSLMNKYGFVMERLPYGHYGVQNYIQKDVIGNYRIMKEDIYWDYWIYMHRKNSVLLDVLDFFILRFFQSGLSEYQETRVVLDNLDTTVEKAILFNTHSKDTQFVNLKLAHVNGAFYLLAFGYIFAILVFILEVILNRKIKV